MNRVQKIYQNVDVGQVYTAKHNERLFVVIESQSVNSGHFAFKIQAISVAGGNVPEEDEGEVIVMPPDKEPDSDDTVLPETEKGEESPEEKEIEIPEPTPELFTIQDQKPKSRFSVFQVIMFICFGMMGSVILIPLVLLLLQCIAQRLCPTSRLALMFTGKKKNKVVPLP